MKQSHCRFNCPASFSERGITNRWWTEQGWGLKWLSCQCKIWDCLTRDCLTVCSTRNCQIANYCCRLRVTILNSIMGWQPNKNVLFWDTSDYLIIKLAIVYRQYENLPLEWNRIIPLPFFSYINNIISFFSSWKKRAYLPLYDFERTRVSCYKLREENKSIKLQMLALKNKIITFASSTY